MIKPIADINASIGIIYSAFGMLGTARIVIHAIERIIPICFRKNADPVCHRRHFALVIVHIRNRLTERKRDLAQEAFAKRLRSCPKYTRTSFCFRPLRHIRKTSARFLHISFPCRISIPFLSLEKSCPFQDNFFFQWKSSIYLKNFYIFYFLVFSS